MGYDLHITRREEWSRTGNDISVKEWLAYVAGDPELSLSPENGPYFVRWSGKSKYAEPWLNWFQGNIYTKNPDEALMEKMLAISRALQARVQGDDGEIYQTERQQPVYPRQSFLKRLRNWLRRPQATPPVKIVTPSFQPGDRVIDAIRKEGTVIAIDHQPNGLGTVKVRYDDGREIKYMLAASGLSRVQNTAGENR